MTGAEVFKLKKNELEKYFGKEEGHRLDSQLTLQRKASGVCVFCFVVQQEKNKILNVNFCLVSDGTVF